ncbi:hypothetical protein JTB14_019764 [Gonioctena quinquepunctata]|nr:hypothetical protein JTB14_019764 [Gonioctena quinquepunctata]
MKLAKALDISLSEEQITSIEVATRNQSENQNWYIQRAGRITASKFKSVCKTNKCKPSLSLIKSICYPTRMICNSKATSWGIHHKNHAVVEYEKNMEGENHEGFQINEIGLIINRKWPQFGATPDRLVYYVEIWEKGSETAKKFHSEVVMPELLGKYFTSKEGAAELIHYCICNGVDDGRPMIRCDGDDCETEWFHFDCVGLLYTPDITWYCTKCDG